MPLYKVVSCGIGCGWYFPGNAATERLDKCPRCQYDYLYYVESDNPTELVPWCEDIFIPIMPWLQKAINNWNSREYIVTCPTCGTTFTVN